MKAEPRDRLGAWLVVVGALLLAAPVHAQPADAASTAREHNRKAIEAFTQGDYELALQEFTHAFELEPDAKIRLNLALTCDNLHLLDEARSHYDAFLREYPEHEKSTSVRRKLKELEGRMAIWGKILVVVDPAPDRAELDGKPLRRVPGSVWVPAGTYVLKTERSGFQPVSRTVEVLPGARM
ncbi:MAG: PEGA domain-containing protein, partial [Myxococcota bacterium]